MPRRDRKVGGVKLVGVAMATAIFQWVYICFVAWYVKKKKDCCQFVFKSGV
jgi:Na+-driven multidrug efflux pump